MSIPARTEMLVRFGENLWWLRTQRRFSQEVLAERAGIHRTQITLLERGARSPGLPTFVALAGALDVPGDKLLEGIAFEPPIGGPGAFLVEPLGMPDFRRRG
jgi:transcriptional regulator with XRE-family HTH domain